MTIFLLLLAVSADLADSHDRYNPLYRELRETGIAVTSAVATPLPAPTMADKLDAKKQMAVLAELAGQDYPLEELLRKSVVAPHILKFRDVKPSDPNAPAHGVDVWFIAHGDLDELAKKDFMEMTLTQVLKDRKMHFLRAAELAKRSLAEKSNAQSEERFAYGSLPMLDRVVVSGTNHVVLSRTADSLLIASVLDPRFSDDAEFGNQWQAVEKNDEGKVQLGTPHPYTCSGGYLKVTRLIEPRGALFVEYHQVFTEPKKWFGGANLLRSKLPILVQSEVRAFRREVVKTLGGE